MKTSFFGRLENVLPYKFFHNQLLSKDSVFCTQKSPEGQISFQQLQVSFFLISWSLSSLSYNTNYLSDLSSRVLIQFYLKLHQFYLLCLDIYLTFQRKINLAFVFPNFFSVICFSETLFFCEVTLKLIGIGCGSVHQSNPFLTYIHARSLMQE